MKSDNPNGSTGPNVVSNSLTKTPEGKKACSLNAYRHGLTEAYFSTAPVARESVFSTPEIASELNLEKRLDDANPYQPEAYFSTAPIARESVFSNPEVARKFNLEKRLDDAKIYNHSGKLPKAAKASAGAAVEISGTVEPPCDKISTS